MPTRTRATRNRRTRSSAVADHPPAWNKPQLAALVKAAPDGPDWLHEIKMDGYRMHARVDAGRVNILTRRGNDWTAKYPAIAEAIAGLPAKNAYLDGELCGVLPDGRTAFNLIQNASHTGALSRQLTEVDRAAAANPVHAATASCQHAVASALKARRVDRDTR